MPPQIGTLLTLALAGDAEGVVDGLREEGFIKSSIEIDRPGPARLPDAVPRTGPAHDLDLLPRLDARAVHPHQRPAPAAVVGGLKLNLPPEYLLIHRVWLGGIAVLCQIEGEVPVLQVLSDWLPGFDVEALDYVQWVDE